MGENQVEKVLLLLWSIAAGGHDPFSTQNSPPWVCCPAQDTGEGGQLDSPLQTSQSLPPGLKMVNTDSKHKGNSKRKYWLS